MTDGSIVISVDLDDKEAQAELNRISKKINALQEKLKNQSADRLPMAEKAADLAAQLDAAAAKLEEMKTATQGTYSAAAIEQQAETVKSLTAQYNKADAALQRQDAAIEKTTRELEHARDRAGELSEQLVQVNETGVSAGEGISRAMAEAEKRMQKFERRIIGLARRVFIFTLVTKALRGMREHLIANIKANDEAAASIAKLKGALLTLAQPIVQVIIPAFIKLVNVLTTIITYLAALFSRLSGQSLKQSEEAAQGFQDEQKALKGVGGAAKKAGKELTNFDEINKLSGETAGGGAKADEILPDFNLGEFDDTMLDHILDIATMIGSALLGWRIGRALGLDLAKTLGLMTAIYGAIRFVQDIFDMWKNGITFDNLKTALGDLALVVGGLALAFGKVAAGIALIVGGAALFITAVRDMVKNGVTLENALAAIVGASLMASGALLAIDGALGKIIAGIIYVVAGITLFTLGFKDASENGINFNNTLLMIAGTLMTGIGLTFLTGSVIPAFIGAIAAAGIAIAYFTGHGEELINGLKMVFDGFSKFIKDVFNGDMEAAAEDLKQIWEGVKTAAGAIWSGIKDIAVKVWEDIRSWWNSNVAKYFTAEYWQELGQQMWQGLVNGITSAKDSISQWGTGVIDDVKRVFRIGSPSKEFEEIGEYSIEGLVIGFRDLPLITTMFNTEILNMTTIATAFSDTVQKLIEACYKLLEETMKKAEDITRSATNNMATMFRNMAAVSVSAINSIINALNSIPREITTVHTIIERTVSGGSNLAASSDSVPHLARGAVIPPNREFLAVLGDQRHGTNIEAPLDTIVAAFRAVQGNGGNGREIVLQLDRRELGRAVIDVSNLESQRVGISLGGV